MIFKKKFYYCKKMTLAKNNFQKMTNKPTYEELEKQLNELKKALNEKNQLAELNKLKLNFLTNLSHQIRTKMNTIIGFSNLLINPDIKIKDKHEFINHINNTGNVLLHLGDDIVDIAQIEVGEIKIIETECQINKILNEIHLSFNKLRQTKNKNSLEIIYKTGISHPDFTILTDPFRLQQIISNLTENSLRFTDFGSIEFGYSLKKPANQNEKEFIEFYVKDTGIGIPKEKIKSIFDRINLSKEPYIKKTNGLGLGLTISASLVKILGGNIWIESEVGKGTSIYFTIPYKPIKKTLIQKRSVKSEQKKYNWDGKIILVVEDDDLNYCLIEKMLQNTKAELIWVKNGKQAVDLCRNNSEINLVLMDIQLPELDGYEATRQIIKFRKDLPIISQTAFGMAGEKEKSLNAGCDDYLSKPLSAKKLLYTIEKHINYLAN